MTATLLRAHLRDCDGLAVIHARSFTAPWTATDFVALLAQPGIIGWIAEGKGLLLIRAVADEAEILTLAVVPEARRQRLASRLLAEAILTLRAGSTRLLFLEVAENNLAARKLYAQLGFEACGRRTAYYAQERTGEAGSAADAITMSLDVAGKTPD